MPAILCRNYNTNLPKLTGRPRNERLHDGLLQPRMEAHLPYQRTRTGAIINSRNANTPPRLLPNRKTQNRPAIDRL